MNGALPEIRVEAYDKIDHWHEKLDETAKLKKRDVFERAAADLFLEAQYEHDLAAVQAIADACTISAAIMPRSVMTTFNS